VLRALSSLAAISLLVAPSGCDDCEGEFCDDYLSIVFEREAPWHGTYEVDLDLDGDPVHCSFHVPIAWDAAPIACDDGGTAVGPFGVRHGSTPARVEVTVSFDGQVITTAVVEPHYETPADWKRRCGPRCKQATGLTIVVASTEPSGCTSYCEKGWCDPWLQDCAPEEKCVAWDYESNGTFNAFRCEAEPEVPQQPGASCTVRGSPVSGFDDCVVGAMCLGVDPATLVGECVAFCTGTPDAPACTNALDQCVIENDGVLPLCVPQ